MRARMAANDHTVGIDDNRLAKVEFTNRCRNGIDGRIVEVGIVFVWLHITCFPQFKIHRYLSFLLGLRYWQQ
jgi:hypothetical protein